MPTKPAKIALIILFLTGLIVLWLKKDTWLDLIGQRGLIPALNWNKKTIKGTTNMSWPEGRTVSKTIKYIKLAVAVNYASYRQLPRNEKHLDLANSSIGSAPKVRILSSGIIEILAGDRKNARVYIIPQPNNSLYNRISWSCVSPDVYDINYHIRECRYDKDYKAAKRIQIDLVRGHRLLFKFDKAGVKGLSDHVRKDFDKFLKNMKPSAVKEIVQVEITGYTDPIGSSKRNIKLADSRVAYVREVFAKLGIKRQHIVTRVIGIDPKPRRQCPPSMLREERIECFAQSRRVDIKIKYKKDV